MIAHFPAPYPDELLYSLLARCRMRLGYDYHRMVLRLIFGSRNAKPRIDLPIHLDQAGAAIPRRLLGTGSDIAAKHTLLPFYAPFLHPQMAARIEEAMTSSDHAHGVIALTPLRIGYPDRLRCCRKCWDDDVANGRQRYWRRSHQAPGALVCYVHHEPLAVSAIHTINKPSVQRLVTAEEAMEAGVRPLALGRQNLETLLHIARGAHWLLNENTERPGPERLGVAYRDLLEELELVKGDRLLMKRTRLLVGNKIGKALLSQWSSTFADDEHSWLSQLLLSSRCSRSSQAPLRHLILMAALGYDAKGFFAGMYEPRLSDTIVPVTVEATKSPTQSPCEERRTEIEAWWADEGVSVSEMGRRIGVATDTVRLFAGKIGLPFPRRCNLGIVSMPTIRVRQPRRKRDEVRAAFLRAVERHPTLSQTEISHRTGGLVKWLQKHDAAWLRDHRPLIHRKGGNPGIDWTQRDAECAKRVPNIIKDLQGRGTRLSLSSIGRALEVNLPNLYRRLPETALRCSRAFAPKSD